MFFIQKTAKLYIPWVLEAKPENSGQSGKEEEKNRARSSALNPFENQFFSKTTP